MCVGLCMGVVVVEGVGCWFVCCWNSASRYRAPSRDRAAQVETRHTREQACGRCTHKCWMVVVEVGGVVDVNWLDITCLLKLPKCKVGVCVK